MKPTIFLSHSSKDRQFIEKIANDLHNAKINVWFDEWEIPTGVSFRKRIFEDGIPNCDLFFIYLTDNSIASYWVQKELDAAFIQESQQKGGNIALFVDNDATRPKLTLDLQSLHCPVFNEGSYNKSMFDLISKAWSCSIKKMQDEISIKYRIEIIENQRKVEELNIRIGEFQRAGQQDIDATLRVLANNKITLYGNEHSYLDLFMNICRRIAIGLPKSHAFENVTELFPYTESDLHPIGYSQEIYNFFGLLVIQNLVRVETYQESPDWIYLTEYGSRISLKMLQ